MLLPGPNGDLLMTHRCLELWNEGLSASRISEQVGITRNAVLGRLHRYKKRNPNVSVRNTQPDATARQYVGSAHKRAAHAARQRGYRMAKRAHRPIAIVVPRPAPVPKVLHSPEPPLPFVDLLGGVQWHHERGCCWINSETGHLPVLWCNAPVERSTSWCAYHARLMISRAV